MSSTNANIWMYRETLGDTVGAERDLAGYDVQATDGSIGKIDKASNEAGRGFLVVDTGFWIFGKKRLIPVGVVPDVDHQARTVSVSMTKEQLKQAPDFDDQGTGVDATSYDVHGAYYGQHGW